MARKTKIKVRRDTAANWASVVPEDGELAYDTTGKSLKVGTGTQTFPNLTGIDADKLDGYDATSFVLATDYEDSDVLTKIKNVDGTGSGLDADLLDGQEGTYYASASYVTQLMNYLHAHHTLTGGGTITVASVSGGCRLKWTDRFIAIPVSKTTVSTIGNIHIYQPTTDIPAANCYNGVAHSATADGVKLTSWEALYAVHTIGGGACDYTFKLVNDTHDFTPDRNWILVAIHNNFEHTVKLGTGLLLKYGDTAYKGIVTHTHAGSTTGGQIAHSALSGIGGNDHHAQAHTINGADHTASGLTSGHFLKATGSTTFGFAAHGLTYTDVSAASSGHLHTATYAPVIHNLVDTTNHPVSGLTSGHFLKATGASTYGFGAHGLTYTDVGAASSAHTHATVATHASTHKIGGTDAIETWYTSTGLETVNMTPGNGYVSDTTIAYYQITTIPNVGDRFRICGSGGSPTVRWMYKLGSIFNVLIGGITITAGSTRYIKSTSSTDSIELLYIGNNYYIAASYTGTLEYGE